jgi:hypothetical protein
MLAYFVNSILFAVPLSIPYPWSVYTDVGLAFIWFPGFWYSLGEYVKVNDRQDPALVRVRKIMTVCIVVFAFFGGVLRSVNNMAGALGGQFPFYPMLRQTGRIVEPIVAFAFGVGAVLIRRKLPSPPFTFPEDPAPQLSGKRSPAWFFQVVGVLLILFGFYLSFVDFIALEALVLILTGLILYPIGSLMRRLNKHKSTTSAPP